ncbi:YdbH domain-containing protein [Phaeovibrio sulfidiphilus]|uniref:YdbH domain-containing protein n=1 Tax=Phaeovibrio sulfidiphilus TaxID=1220600 RepID=A0A8J7CP58_9PROT|nr:YdbH domain-containing protein [Phaeovibrio sulfidiphilus]
MRRVAVLVVCVAAVVLWLNRLAAASWALGLGLGAMGLEGASARVVHLGPSRMVIQEVRPGTGPSVVQDVEVTASPLDLLRGRVASLRIGTVHLFAVADGAGVWLPGLEPLFEGEGDFPAEGLIRLADRFRTLEIGDGRLEILDVVSGEPVVASARLSGQLDTRTRRSDAPPPAGMHLTLEPLEKSGPDGLRLREPASVRLSLERGARTRGASGGLPALHLILSLEGPLVLDTADGPARLEDLRIQVDTADFRPADTSGAGDPGEDVDKAGLDAGGAGEPGRPQGARPKKDIGTGSGIGTQTPPGAGTQTRPGAAAMAQTGTDRVASETASAAAGAKSGTPGTDATTGTASGSASGSASGAGPEGVAAGDGEPVPKALGSSEGPRPGVVVRMSVGRLLWQGTGLEALDFRVRVPWEAGAPLPARARATLEARIDRLPLEEEYRLPGGKGRPLVLDARLDPYPTSEDLFAVEGTVHVGAGGATMRVKGHVARDLGSARLHLHMPESAFSPALRAQDFHGLLAGRLDLREGTISLGGRLDWDGDTVTPDLKMALDNLTGRFDALAFQNLTTAVSITRFEPLEGHSSKAVAELLGPGIPLTNGQATWRFDGRGNIVLQSFRCRFAEGEITASGIRIPLGDGAVESSLAVEGLSLDALVRLLEVEKEMEARGFLSGSIPFRVETDGTIRIRQAALRSTGPGILRYTPSSGTASAAGGVTGSARQGVVTLLEALQDFHFRTLNVSLDGDLTRDLSLEVFLAGANPRLLDGYPVEVRTTLSGAFLELIGANVYTYEIPSRIRGNLDAFLKSVEKSGIGHSKRASGPATGISARP